jgi:thioredoxin reductase
MIRIPDSASRSESPIGNRFFYETYPIRNIRDARIAVIGAGDAAFDYALQMSLYNKVHIFNRSDRLKCLSLLYNQASANPGITYLDNHILDSTSYDFSQSCLKLLFQTQGGMKSYLADYIIFAIGRRPELRFADPGLFSLFEQLQQEKKLYLAGDVKNELLRQASIAAGDGIKTAMQIYFNESH